MILMLDIRMWPKFRTSLAYWSLNKLAKTYWLLMADGLMLSLIKVNIVCVRVLNSENVWLFMFYFPCMVVDGCQVQI